MITNVILKARPAGDGTFVLGEHLTSKQMLDVAEALVFVKSQTTHGRVEIEIVKGVVRRVAFYCSKEFEKEE